MREFAQPMLRGNHERTRREVLRQNSRKTSLSMFNWWRPVAPAPARSDRRDARSGRRRISTAAERPSWRATTALRATEWRGGGGGLVGPGGGSGGGVGGVGLTR